MEKEIERLRIPIEYGEMAKAIFQEKTTSKAVIECIKFAEKNVATSMNLDKATMDSIRLNIDSTIYPVLERIETELESSNTLLSAINETLNDIANKLEKETDL